MSGRYQESEGKPDAMSKFVKHVVSSRYEDLSEKAIESTKTFILDSLGVMISGTLAPGALL